MGTITIGIDLAKHVFSTCAVDARGHVLRRHDFGREAFAVWLAQLPAGTVVASIGGGREFDNGRQLSAWIGLVPTQHSSGGEQRLGAISCDGDAWLRHPMVQRPASAKHRQAEAA